MSRGRGGRGAGSAGSGGGNRDDTAGREQAWGNGRGGGATVVSEETLAKDVPITWSENDEGPHEKEMKGFIRGCCCGQKTLLSIKLTSTLKTKGVQMRRSYAESLKSESRMK